MYIDLPKITINRIRMGFCRTICFLLYQATARMTQPYSCWYIFSAKWRITANKKFKIHKFWTKKLHFLKILKGKTLTDNQDESLPDIYRNKLSRHLLGMHHNNLDCDHDLADDNMDAAVFYSLVSMFHDYLADVLTLESTAK